MSTPQFDSAHYSYRVTWSIDDDEFVATCVEFPSLSWLADSPEAALSGLRSLVDEVLADMRTSDESVPEPMSKRHYSGKFQVRMSEGLHRRLALQAAEERVSLNQYVTQRLASAS